MNTQLLCTFSTIKDYTDDISKISNFYEVMFGKVYVLQNKDNLDKLMLTYNIKPSSFNEHGFYTNTISVHRKKDTNTIYTINSLNSLIKDLNHGILDHNFSINWSHYQNTILLTDASSYKTIPTKLYRIISI
jgi:hypothetical protein